MAAEYGIDVSHYQGNINWNLVRQSGKSFAIVKATEGSNFIDSRFSNNWKNAKSAGLKVGAYHYFRPGISPTDQAKHYYNVVGNLNSGDMVPWIDVEDAHSSFYRAVELETQNFLTTRWPEIDRNMLPANNPSLQELELQRTFISRAVIPYAQVLVDLRNCVKAFSDIYGFAPGIYTGQWFWNLLPDTKEFKHLPLWVAYWFKDQQPGGEFSLPRGWDDYVIHQYTSRGFVGGISGNVDLNWSADLSPALVHEQEGDKSIDDVIEMLETVIEILKEL